MKKDVTPTRQETRYKATVIKNGITTVQKREK